LLRAKSEEASAEEETVRDLYFTELELFAEQALQSLDMIVQENKILMHAQSGAHATFEPVRDPRQMNRGSPIGFSERLDGSGQASGRGGPLLSKEGKPLQPFTITSQRDRIRQGVFRPGHTLPTMSIEDYLEEEKRRGGIIDGGSEENSGPAGEVDEDNVERADQETMKARQWDEYTEDNPKGAGNTLNRG
jgi:immunoglobulin-binding protein 1